MVLVAVSSGPSTWRTLPSIHAGSLPDSEGWGDQSLRLSWNVDCCTGTATGTLLEGQAVEGIAVLLSHLDKCIPSCGAAQAGAPASAPAPWSAAGKKNN